MKTLLLGFDAFDPGVFEELYERNLVPNLAKYVGAGGYSQFQVSNPPQSEVSWTSIATGLNPGAHGMFDFVHRTPDNYGLHVSLLPTTKTLAGTQFVRPYAAKTIFDQTVDQGYPATALWWPATFPARPESPVRTIPGLGAPDIHGRLGVGSLFLSQCNTPGQQGKTPVYPLVTKGASRFEAVLPGPARKTRNGDQETTLPLSLDISSGDKTATLLIGKQKIGLHEGIWSPIFELQFRMGRFVSVRAITRVIMTQTHPDVALYFLPLQLHPLHTPWRYGTPRGMVKKMWSSCGPFLTLGWPQDTVGLEDGCINDAQFLDLCDSIFTSRVCSLKQQIDGFNEGLLAVVFDTLDRVQHMFWRDRPDVLETWYRKLDSLVGEVENSLNEPGKGKSRLVIVSDHGFADFNHKVHLNRWLIQKGYLITKDDVKTGDLKSVDWSKTQAYAIGLNSIYINQAGREAQGQVSLAEREALLHKICEELSSLENPQGRSVVHRALKNDQVFDGPLVDHGPDIVVGYSPGFRASQQTGLGGWEDVILEPNTDHWGADHCIDPLAVPGVLFSNVGLENYSQPSYRDIPAITIDSAPDSSGIGAPPTPTDEDEAAIEERLKSLGYL